MSDDIQVTEPERNEDMTAVRRLMMEQLRALRSAAPGEQLAQELKRSKGVSELSATIIDSARVEVQYLQVIHGDGEVPFLAPPDAATPRLPPPQQQTKNPLDAGPSASHPWRATVHKLKG